MISKPVIKHEIEELIADAVHAAQAAGELPAVAVHPMPVERPQRPEHGDYASSLPLRLARTAGMNPLEIAGVIARRIEAGARAALRSSRSRSRRRASSTFGSRPRGWPRRCDESSTPARQFGNVDIGHGQKVQVEFVSANPVGPIHVGNGRGLALGDTLARVLEAAGFEVQREYLVNDAGTQTETFAATLYARYQQLFGREVDIPEGGYPGEYMVELATRIKDEHGDALLRDPGEPYPPELHDIGVQMMVDSIKQDLSVIGVHYDNWFSERSLYKGDTYEKAMALLRSRNCVAEREGAVWLISSTLGEEKDNVLVRSTGAPTYFASDIAYHYDKFVLRGFDRVIDIWGADHQGHVPRMKAAVNGPRRGPGAADDHHLPARHAEARNGDREALEARRRDHHPARGRRGGRRGRRRFYFLSRSADAQMDFDLELAKSQSAENPVYYVQYAHARIAGILIAGGRALR